MNERRFNPIGWATNAAVERVDINSVLEEVDVDELVDRLDINALLARVDPDVLLDRVDVNAVLDRVEPNRLLDRVDPDRLLDRVDPDRLLDRVDPDRLLDRVDPNLLLDRVDANRLLDRVDPNELIARTDLNAAMAEVDLDAMLARVDVRELVERAGVPEIVRESTGHMAGSLLDIARRQIVALDQILMRLTGAVFHRGRKLPSGPAALQASVAPAAPLDQDRGVITGHYAGPISRLCAFLIDAAIVFGGFTIMSAGVFYLINALFGEMASPTLQTIVGVSLFAFWAFCYAVVALAVAGRTVGKGVIGLRVVDRSGRPIRFSQALVRVLVMPFSFLFLGLGFIGLFVGTKRRALHDIAARTCVVYDWGERPAEMPAPLTRWLRERDDVPVD
ncbi:MAG: RDD family protein [Actinobacteria bacterium]|nr:RDD family protein [Actinomycetota bacterium]